MTGLTLCWSYSWTQSRVAASSKQRRQLPWISKNLEPRIDSTTPISADEAIVMTEQRILLEQSGHYGTVLSNLPPK